MIIFGGQHSTSFGAMNDVYYTTVSAPNENWNAVVAPNAPTPVYGHTAGYNPTTRVMVTTTGATGAKTLAPCLSSVSQLANANGVGTSSWSTPTVTGQAPSSRAFTAYAYDPVGDNLIHVGGTDCNGNYLSDIYILQGATSARPNWQRLTVPGPNPAPRSGATAIYDTARNTLTLYGGGQGGNIYFSDVWVLSNANGLGGTPAWTQLSPIGIPPIARSGHWATYSQTTGTMMMGSGNSAIGLLSDTWELSNATGFGVPEWTQLTTTGQMNTAQTSAIIASNQTVVTFGGQIESSEYFSPTDDTARVLSAQ
jgi:hypothetical protein